MNKQKWVWFKDSLVTANEDGSVGMNSKTIMFRIPGTFTLEYPNEADSHLIAAAPELLVEVKTLIEVLEKGTESTEDLEEIIKWSKNIIAKAEGGGE